MQIRLLPLVFVAFACARQERLPHPALSTQDFFLAPSDSLLFQGVASTVSRLSVEMPAGGCRDHIHQIACLVDPVVEGDPNPRVCQPVSAELIEPLQKVYDVYPPQLQKVFCSLGRIYIEKQFIGTAYAGLDEKGEKAIMGIRETALSQPLTLASWASWKEQLSFGGTKTGYSSVPELPRIESSMNVQGASDFLYFVIAHEFGHVLDFAKKVNVFDCPSGSDPSKGPVTCAARRGDWSALSWESQVRGLPESSDDPWGLRGWVLNPLGRFAFREDLCFYGCNSPAHPERAGDLYAGLYRSNLLTAYAATNAWDDFAESLAFYAAGKLGGFRYDVRLPDGTVYDLAGKVNEPVFASKLNYLESFFEKL
jgi:hypothetical protein